MLSALDKDGNRVYAWNVKYGNKYDYFCPHCKNPVFVKKGEIRVHHFAHYPYSACSYKEWEPETGDHMKMKMYFYKALRGRSWVEFVDIEYKVGSNIADVYVETVSGKRIAIECQASKCSYKRMDEKTSKYHDEGVYVIWVVKKGVKARPVEIFGRKVVCVFTNKPYVVDIKTKERGLVNFNAEPCFTENSCMFYLKNGFSDGRRSAVDYVTKEKKEEEKEPSIDDVFDGYDVEVDFAKIMNARNIRCSKCGRVLISEGKLNDFGMVIEGSNSTVIICDCGRVIKIRGVEL